jgi:alkanesulfonate monooxygenase SsuD/methylene tetrahydromethanopterin reductase-like flavin-dependent oxidoreductase (luciferase family)
MPALVGLRFDLRVPSFATTTHDRQYAACLDMCEWADAQGFDAIAISEHHGVDDGYVSAPVTLAAAIAARTKRISINIAAVLVPLHDPIRLAEELATAALVAGGRLSVVAGLGYRHGIRDGGRRSDQARALRRVRRRAPAGVDRQPFEWRGRQVRVTPKPASPR